MLPAAIVISTLGNEMNRIMKNNHAVKATSTLADQGFIYLLSGQLENIDIQMNNKSSELIVDPPAYLGLICSHYPSIPFTSPSPSPSPLPLNILNSFSYGLAQIRISAVWLWISHYGFLRDPDALGRFSIFTRETFFVAALQHTMPLLKMCLL